jgi:hypothetical protein
LAVPDVAVSFDVVVFDVAAEVELADEFESPPSCLTETLTLISICRVQAVIESNAIKIAGNCASHFIDNLRASRPCLPIKVFQWRLCVGARIRFLTWT